MVRKYALLFSFYTFDMHCQYCYLNLTLYHIHCCLITGISNVTADTTTNLTNRVRKTKETKHEMIDTIMFGMIGLAAVSFIIYMIYIYTLALEKRPLYTAPI